MSSGVMEIISSPEFWLSVAFCAVVLLALKPLHRYLTKWGQERAIAVQQEIDESAQLRRKAEDLLAEYKEKTRHKARERSAILARAKEEAVYLQTEANQKLQERLAKQDEDVAVRLSLVKEQGQKELKDKILKTLMHQTNQLLEKNSVSPKKQQDEMDQSLDLFFKTLEAHTDSLVFEKTNEPI